jgi:hypothetical protein
VLVHSHPQNYKKTAQLKSDVHSYQEGKEGIAKTSGTDSGNSVLASRTMQKAGASGDVVADGHHESRRIEVGSDILDNNAVNILMAGIVSVGAMVIACMVWGLPLSSLVAT